jgi:hypothetical protein
MGGAAALQAQENYPWILHPAIDLIFVCGGLVWLFGAIFLSNLVHVSTETGNMLYFVFFMVFVVPHGMATMVRIIDVPATRKASGLKVLLLGVLCFALMLFGCFSEFGASFVGRMALAFSFQHGLGQAYGISLIYCYKRKFYLSKVEKKIYWLTVQAGILLGVVVILGHPQIGFASAQLVPILPAFPAWVDRALDVTFGVSVLVFLGVLVRKYIREKQLMPLPALLTMGTGLFIFAIVIPHAAYIGGWFAVLYYTAHGLFHTPQYLVVTTAAQLKNRGWPESLPLSKISSRLCSKTAFMYFLTVYSIAWVYMFSSTKAPAVMTSLGMVPHPELWYLAFISATNLHHYWTDALIWKLRDKDNMRLLIS